ncbi:flavin reductase family protein [Aquisediminimonas sediminicola]|uniref:flavin reductase family protein n=1 Tax=Alteraquisediminimonas sediminicola TaxID=2676787 RepID=UPI001C8EF5BD|nr:flavin reductase family protein [Aquisediminimonas sediminicola]
MSSVTEVKMAHEEIASALKIAMRHMPSPVALITATDPESGAPVGLAATAFVPVAMDPASMLVCINHSGSAYAAIKATGAFCINILGLEHTATLAPFASSDRREERFEGAHWQTRNGIPYLEGTAANIFCRNVRSDIFGTHEIFIGEVFDIMVETSATPALWHAGKVVGLTGA